MNALWNDLRYAGGALLRHRLFTVPAGLSLALGIGANVTIFTFIYAAFVNPLPVADPSRLIAVFSLDERNPGRMLPVSYLNYTEYRDNNEVVADLAAYRTVSLSFEIDDGIQLLFGEIVTANYFDVLGVRALRGRTFLPDEGRTPGTHPVVVLSHGLWQRSFGADPELVGKVLEINDQSFTVVGISTPGFKGLSLFRSPDFWVPMMMREQVLNARLVSFFDRRDAYLLSAVGRLRAGVDLAQARAGMEALTRNLVAAYPGETEGLGVAVLPLKETVLPVKDRSKFVLAGWLLAAVVALLLLVACANVANLLLARSLARRREIAIRLAVGIGRGRLFGQLLAEGLLLAVAGGVAALVLAVWGRNVLWALRPPYLPDTLELGFNPAVLGFALGLSLLTGALVALAPAHQAFRLDLVSELKDRSSAQHRFHGWLSPGSLLLVAQVTLSVVVLVGAGLFLGSLRLLQRIDAGFDTDNLFLLPVPKAYGKHEGQEFYRQVLDRVGSFPGVRAATLCSRPVLAPGGSQDSVVVEGQEEREGVEGVLVSYNQVVPGYFQAMGIPLLRGRTFTAADREDAPRVALINETMARWLWPREEALGRRFRLDSEEEFNEVIGVVKDVKYGGLDEEPRPYIYLAARQTFSPVMLLHVRTDSEPGPLIAAARREINALDSSIPLLSARLTSDLIENSLWAPRMIAGMLTLFGLLALVLCTVGIYGVVGYATSQRSREFGIRLAMGATRRDILGLVLKQGMGLAAIGIIVGWIICGLLSSRIADLLFEVPPIELGSYAGAGLLLALVTLAAVSVPARQASRVDPMVVLREE